MINYIQKLNVVFFILLLALSLVRVVDAQELISEQTPKASPADSDMIMGELADNSDYFHTTIAELKANTFQALDSNLTAIAALTTNAYGRALLEAANEAAFKALVNLEAGTDFYSVDAADAAFEPLDVAITKTDEVETITADWVNTANPWADNEMADNHSHAADAIDAITEIASGLKSGDDATLVTGTSGTNGNCAEWNSDGDLIDSGAACGAGGGGASDVIAEGDSSVEVIDAGTGQVDIDVDGANVGRWMADGLDASGGIKVPTGTDPDVDEVGKISYDSDDGAYRGYSSNRSSQVSIGFDDDPVTIAIGDPGSFPSWTGRANNGMPVWRNPRNFTYNIVSIACYADTDDFALNFFKTGSSIDYSDENDVLLDTVTCSNNGTEVYYVVDSSQAVSTIEANRAMFAEVSSGTAGSVLCKMNGYYDADVD